MDLERIMSLWDRFDRSSATEMEFQTKELHFTLKKGNVNAAEEAESGKPSRQAAPEAGQKEKPQEAADGKGSILSPLAGTFYRAPSPDEEPYVSIGDMVHVGDIIGQIEAMKTFNEVRADKEGVVREILAQDGELVEYHQALITVG